MSAALPAVSGVGWNSSAGLLAEYARDKEIYLSSGKGNEWRSTITTYILQSTVRDYPRPHDLG